MLTHADSGVGVILKSAGAVAGDLCVFGARHPRAARAARPIGGGRLSPPLARRGKADQPRACEGLGQQVASAPPFLYDHV